MHFWRKCHLKTFFSSFMRRKCVFPYYFPCRKRPFTAAFRVFWKQSRKSFYGTPSREGVPKKLFRDCFPGNAVLTGFDRFQQVSRGVPKKLFRDSFPGSSPVNAVFGTLCSKSVVKRCKVSGPWYGPKNSTETHFQRTPDEKHCTSLCRKSAVFGLV